MFGLRQSLIFATLLVSAFVSAAPQHSDDSVIDWSRLSSILDTIDNNVLHSVLHNLSPKFRDGVFSKDRAAIEHVHSTNPVLASKLVYIAKRQNNGTTTAAVARTTSTSIAPVAATVSDAVSALIVASTVPAPTTIRLAPSTVAGETAISTVPGGVVFSTIGGNGVVTRTSSAVGVSFTRSTSTHIYTYTAADGSTQTSTSLIVVNAPVTATAVQTGAQGAAQSSGAGLQNGATRHTSNELSALLSAAVFGVLGLFVAL